MGHARRVVGGARRVDRPLRRGGGLGSRGGSPLGGPRGLVGVVLGGLCLSLGLQGGLLGELRGLHRLGGLGLGGLGLLGGLPSRFLSLLGELGDGCVFLVLRTGDELADLQKLPDVRGAAVERDASGRSHIGAAHADDLDELHPLVLLTLEVLALGEELPDVVARPLQSGAPGLLHIGPARVDNLGNPHPVVLAHGVFPAPADEGLKFLPGSRQRRTSCGQQLRATYRGELSSVHPRVL